MKKVCFKCNILKDLSEFYAHPAMGDGHLNKCKCCTKKDVAKRIEVVRNDLSWVLQERARCREKENRRRAAGLSVIPRDKKLKATNAWRKRNVEKARAHRKVRHFMSTGLIKRESCCVCGNHKAQAHHEDYSRPLEIVWLCPKHHAIRHRQLRGEPGLEISSSLIATSKRSYGESVLLEE